MGPSTHLEGGIVNYTENIGSQNMSSETQTCLSWHLIGYFQMRKGPFCVLFDSPSQLRTRFCGHPYQTRSLDGSSNFSLHKQLLSTCSGPGTVLGPEEALNKAEEISAA